MGAHWQAFFIAAPLMALTPGVNQLLSLRNALQQGPFDAIVALSGRFTAFLFLTLATAFGLGALLLASEPAFAVVKWCGVAYLLYLGGRMLFKGEREPSAPSFRRGRWDLVRQEFWVALTNPKALLLFAAFLPQFADRTAGAVMVQLVALGVAYIAVEFLAALVYAAVGAGLGAFELTVRTRRLFDRATGITMVAVAGALAFGRH